MKRILIAWLTVLPAAAALSVWAFHAAFIQRGYMAYGGECMIFPAALYGLIMYTSHTVICERERRKANLYKEAYTWQCKSISPNPNARHGWKRSA